MKVFAILFLVMFVAGSVFTQQNPDLGKLVEAERAFAQMAREKSTKEAFLYYMADEGVVFEPEAVNAREVWSKRPDSPALLSWEPIWADISADGSIGYTAGPWEFRPEGKDGKPVAFGQYVSIWKKQKNGEFRVILDIGITHKKPERHSLKLRYPEEPSVLPRIICCFWGAVEAPLESLSHNARIYREGMVPLSGALARKQLKEEARTFDGTPKCDGTTSFQYCYGVIRTSSDKRFNFLQILTDRSATMKWQVDLDLLNGISS